MIESLKKNKYGILLMLVSSLLVCFGQYFWKRAEGTFWLIIIGFALYALGALIMLIAYRFGSLSVLQPVLALNYVFALLISHFLLNETIEPLDYVGIGVIFVGVFFIAAGDAAFKKKKVEDKEEAEQ